MVDVWSSIRKLREFGWVLVQVLRIGELRSLSAKKSPINSNKTSSLNNSAEYPPNSVAQIIGSFFYRTQTRFNNLYIETRSEFRTNSPMKTLSSLKIPWSSLNPSPNSSIKSILSLIFINLSILAIKIRFFSQFHCSLSLFLAFHDNWVSQTSISTKIVCDSTPDALTSATSLTLFSSHPNPILRSTAQSPTSLPTPNSSAV